MFPNGSNKPESVADLAEGPDRKRVDKQQGQVEERRL